MNSAREEAKDHRGYIKQVSFVVCGWLNMYYRTGGERRG
jgi:hypothetical protein